MKKFVGLILALMMACSFCAVSFASDIDSTASLSTSDVGMRRSEPVEVVSVNYMCFDGKDYYNHYEYKTYMVPAGKTLVSTGSYIDWVKENYTYAGRTWRSVIRTVYTYEIQ